MAKDMKEKATERSKSILESRKNDAAGRLEGTAKVFRQTAQSFQGENPTVSRYADQIADKIEGASKYLREKDVKELVGDTERFIRKQPALFFGAAFAMGIITARFLKSSRQNAGM
jgi:hypothetical protein